MKNTNKQPDTALKSLSIDEINQIENFRKSRQTAILTILFSDIVNSSFATEKLGEESYSRLRHIHDELFKKIMCRDNAGIIIKQIGDSFLCVFAEPSTAVIRAIEFQRAIHSNKEHLTSNRFTLTVRIGINLGQVVVENSLAMDIFGTHVNRAARLEAIAHGGQIITSQSVWENAAGWLKDHDDKNIGWLAYGKVKLKGIEKAVDVYGFYPKELGKPRTPEIIYNQKRKRNLVFALITLIIAVGLVILITNLTSKKNMASTVDTRKTYYVQFDFTGLKDSMGKVNVDTPALEQDLLTEIITVLNPDSILTEDDLIKQFSKEGKLYTRFKTNETDSGSTDFFMDTLHLSASLFIRVNLSKHTKDSVWIGSHLVVYEKDSSTSSAGNYDLYSLNDASKQMRNDLQDMLSSTSNAHWEKQGYVISSNDSILLFRTTKDAQLRQGTAIRFMREYQKGKEGIQNRLDDIKIYIDYYSHVSLDTIKVNEYKNDYADLEKNLKLAKMPGNSFGSFSTGIDIEGKVLEMYDSTGKAAWHKTGLYPEKPRAEDIIYYR